MKKSTIITVSIILTLVLAMSIFVACDKIKNLGAPETEVGEKTVTVIIGEDKYAVTTDAEYVHDLLLEMKEKGKIVYEFSDSAYGATIEKLNALENDSVTWTKWIGVYHDVEEMDLISAGFDVEYDGKTYHSSNLGVETLPVRNGATYYFKQN